MEDVLKCYKVLDVPPGAGAEQVRRAYIELAHVWHPDRYPSNPVLRQKAKERMAEVEAAYQTLQAFLPDLSQTENSEAEVDQGASKAQDVIQVTDSGVSQKLAIAGVLVLAIVGLLVLALTLMFRGRAVPVYYH